MLHWAYSGQSVANGLREWSDRLSEGHDDSEPLTALKSARLAPMRTIPTRQRAELASPQAWIKPQLAKLTEKAPDGPDWLHELKLDGYRMHARLDAGRVQILTRRANNWTDKILDHCQIYSRTTGAERLS